MDKWLIKSAPTNDEINVQPSTSSGIKSRSEAPPPKRSKTNWSRHYSEEYLKFGFVSTGSDNHLPVCVICLTTLSNECMKPSKLKRHLETKHPDHMTKSLDFFKNKKSELLSAKKIIHNTCCTGSKNENLVMASYEISKLIAENGYSHTVGEKLIMPVLKIVTSRVFEKKQENQLKLLSLSNNTVKRRIVDMAEHIQATLIQRVQLSQFFALQVDESTDVADNANLICFVRYVYNDTAHEDLLFCKALTTRTTAEEIFNTMNDFITQHGIEWKKCVGLSSDGARAMAGLRTGVFPRVKTVAPECVWVHCSIHREALATKKIPALLNSTVQESVKFINFIKSRPMNSRIFTVLCNEMGSEHEHLLLHCEVRWLSKGNVLKRLFELRNEVLLFLEEHPPTSKDTIFEFRDRFHDLTWLLKLAYLCDIFDFLNELNKNLQGDKVDVFKVSEKVEAAIKKIQFWLSRLNKGNYSGFITLTDFKNQHGCEIPDEVSTVIKEHLSALVANLKDYFPPIECNKMWIRNPFLVNIEEEEALKLTDLEMHSLIELSCSSALKDRFGQESLINFWLSCRSEYTSLAEKAVKFLMPFVTTYRCEAAFSSLVFLKNKYRSRLDVEKDLRIKLSSFSPDLKLLCSEKQHHPSH